MNLEKHPLVKLFRDLETLRELFAEVCRNHPAFLAMVLYIIWTQFLNPA